MAFNTHLYHARLTIPVRSGIPADAVEMNFHYRFVSGGGDPVDADFDALAAAIFGFFNHTPTGGSQAVAYYLGDEISNVTDSWLLNFYLVPTAGGHEGSPVKMRTGQGVGRGTHTMPEEVAAVLSFRAAYGADVEFGGGSRPRSRDRNRIYLGPLDTAVIAQDSTTKRTKLSATFITDVLISATEELYGAAVAANWFWRVVSHKAVVDKDVAFVSMDDAFDSQRRRGPKATTRVENSVV